MAEYRLENCPCGSHAYAKALHSEFWWATCVACDFQTPAEYADEPEAVHAWNLMCLAGEMERLLRKWRGMYMPDTQAVDALHFEVDALLARLAPGKEGE